MNSSLAKLRELKWAAMRLIICVIVLAIGCACSAGELAAEQPAAESNVEVGKGNEIHGLSLGEYRIRSYHQVDAQKSTIRFTLYATVKDEHVGQAQRLIEEHRQKIRDQVITATRLAPLNVFQEPDLSDFRRRVIVRIHRAIPELVIEELFVSEFDLTIKSL